MAGNIKWRSEVQNALMFGAISKPSSRPGRHERSIKVNPDRTSLAPAALLICLAALALPLGAQTSSTEIAGLVTDSTGSIVAGAEVTLTRIATGESRHAATNNDGLYSFPLIEPGEYKISVGFTGFKSTIVSNINVLYQQRARVDIKLELGELTQSVQVMAEARLLNTEDAAIGQNVESKRVVELPVAYPSVGQLALLVPGVSFGTRMGITTGARLSRKRRRE